ncbi:hypothetical protein SLA2020_386100 [Shorea laevis]
MNRLFRSSSPVSSRSSMGKILGIVNHEEVEYQEDSNIDFNVWNIPKVPIKNIYKKTTWSLKSFSSEQHVKTVEQSKISPISRVIQFADKFPDEILDKTQLQQFLGSLNYVADFYQNLRKKYASDIGYGGILKQRVHSTQPEQIVRFYLGVWTSSQSNYRSQNSIPDFLTREFLQGKNDR